MRLWESPLRENPITAPPLLFDVDGDGYGDVVLPSFSGEVWGVHGESGHIVDNWPFYLEDRSFHAGPLVVMPPTLHRPNPALKWVHPSKMAPRVTRLD